MIHGKGEIMTNGMIQMSRKPSNEPVYGYASDGLRQGERIWSPRENNALDLPDIVVIPRATEEMVQITRIALQYGIPIVPFGGGTGMGEVRLPGKVASWWRQRG